MSVVKAITFGVNSDTHLGHVFCLVHHQVVMGGVFLCLKTVEQAGFSRKYGSSMAMSKTLTEEVQKNKTLPSSSRFVELKQLPLSHVEPPTRETAQDGPDEWKIRHGASLLCSLPCQRLVQVNQKFENAPNAAGVLAAFEQHKADLSFVNVITALVHLGRFAECDEALQGHESVVAVAIELARRMDEKLASVDSKHLAPMASGVVRIQVTTLALRTQAHQRTVVLAASPTTAATDFG